MGERGPGGLSRLEAYRVALGFLALVAGAVIIYRSASYPSFGAFLVGGCFVAFGIFRLRWFSQWLKQRYPRR